MKQDGIPNGAEQATISAWKHANFSPFYKHLNEQFLIQREKVSIKDNGGNIDID